MKQCFEGLIGLSQLSCDCFDVDNDLKSSKFGLFLDELEGIDLQLIQTALKCKSELGTNFESIYSRSVNFFESDLQKNISDLYSQRHRPYIGRVGEKRATQSLSTDNVSGIKLNAQNVEGASIVINSLSLYFLNTGTLTLQVFKNGEQFGNDIVIQIEANKTSYSINEPIKLPLVEHGIINEYFIVYDSTNLIPLNNKNSCGCSGIESLRSKFIKPQGVSGSDVDNLEVNNTYAYGLSLNVMISCDIDNLICDFMLEGVFERRAALAIWYKMGILTIEELFSSREINFDTFSDREYLYGRKNKFTKEYNSLVYWLANNTNIKNSNCFVCDSAKVMSMGKNLI